MMVAKKLNIFVAPGGDVPLRDDRESMSVSMVSLSKGKRTKPIEWTSADGDQSVCVTADATHGMATIWDMDIVIWSVSQINAAVEASRPVSPVVSFHPHDMLKAIGREVGGDHYKALEDALRRLKGTNVETNIRTASRHRKQMFSLLNDWQHDTDNDTGRSRGMQITLPQWVFNGAMQQDVLAIPLTYFKLKSGIARFLYRVARRHAGQQDQGFRLAMKTLHARSGSVQPMKEFARAVRKVVEEQGIPEYRLDLIDGKHGDEVLVMVRDRAKVGLPQRRDLAKIDLPPAACSGDGHGGSPAAPHGGSPAKTRRITRRSTS